MVEKTRKSKLAGLSAVEGVMERKEKKALNPKQVQTPQAEDRVRQPYDGGKEATTKLVNGPAYTAIPRSRLGSSRVTRTGE